MQLHASLSYWSHMEMGPTHSPFSVQRTMSRQSCPVGQLSSRSLSHSCLGHPFASKRQLSPHFTVSLHGKAVSQIYQSVYGHAGSEIDVVEPSSVPVMLAFPVSEVVVLTLVLGSIVSSVVTEDDVLVDADGSCVDAVCALVVSDASVVSPSVSFEVQLLPSRLVTRAAPNATGPSHRSHCVRDTDSHRREITVACLTACSPLRTLSCCRKDRSRRLGRCLQPR